MSDESLQERMLRERAQKKDLEKAKNLAFQYIDEVSNQRVVPSDDSIQGLSVFDEPMPLSPSPDVLDLLGAYGSPAAVAQTGGRYFGFVNGNVIPAALGARWLADAWDQNAALYVISPIAAKLEQVCEIWLKELFDLPDETVAGLVSGTSVATQCGFAAARNELLKRHGWDAVSDGLNGSPGIRVVASEQAHGTVFKALALLGIGHRQIELVPSDDQGRIISSEIPHLGPDTLLVLQAGNVNTGAFDEFTEICGAARKAGAWVHIDGAFGLWAAVSRKKSNLTAGIGLADSWSVDGHKTLNTPYDCGIVLCRHPQALVSAMQASGTYIQFSEERDGMLYGPDMSRRARSVELWAALKYLGRHGLEELIDGMCDRASQFGQLLRTNGFQVLNEVCFNQVLVACDSPEETARVLDAIQASGVFWCGGTTWRGDPAIRISICSWATTEHDVAVCVEEMVRIKEKAL